MLYFENDYCEGAHPAILQKLVETNFEKVSGYGTDPYCASAKEKIRAACACPEADVFFISGGTQANAVVIGSMLHRWEGVLAATTGHVAAHEAGAIEFTGHKVLSLVSEGTDVTLADIARLTDVFYIGGTKVGALCGEAVVFPHGAPAHFMTMVKQQGALLAKGRLMGLQFDVLFTDGLYTEISKNAIETAAVLKKGLAEKGYQFFMDSPTNQIFVVFPNAQLEALEGKAKFGFWEKYDDTHTVMRIATSWATRMEEVRQLLALL